MRLMVLSMLQNRICFHQAIDPIYDEGVARFPWEYRDRYHFPTKEMGSLFPAGFSGGCSLLIEGLNPPCHTGF